MGSLARVQLHYIDLLDAFDKYGLTPIGTDTNGKNMYNAAITKNAVLVMGNEGGFDKFLFQLAKGFLPLFHL